MKKYTHKHVKYSENKKTHTFFLKIEVEMMNKWRFFESELMSLREVKNGEDNEQSQKFEGKLKTFKN